MDKDLIFSGISLDQAWADFLLGFRRHPCHKSMRMKLTQVRPGNSSLGWLREKTDLYKLRSDAPEMRAKYISKSGIIVVGEFHRRGLKSTSRIVSLMQGLNSFKFLG